MLSVVLGSASVQVEAATRLRALGYNVLCPAFREVTATEQALATTRVILGPIASAETLCDLFAQLIPLRVTVTVLKSERDVWRCACAAASSR
jgi:hypothetical protein